MRLTCLLFFGLVLTRTQAQPGSTNMAIRYIKLGNTMREARQYGQARSYLDKALVTLKKAGDRYWTAADYENLGLIGRDLNNPTQANFYLGESLKSYQATGEYGSTVRKPHTHDHEYVAFIVYRLSV